MKGYIYKLESPSGNVYIGITKNFEKRMSVHKQDSKRLGFQICMAIKKYGFDNFKKEIIETVEAENDKELRKLMCEREIFYISKYNSYKKGYNMTIGGDNVVPKYGKDNHFYGKHHTEETKKKISEKATNRKLTEEHKRKISLGGMGKKHSKESIEKMCKIQRELKAKKVICVETQEIFDTTIDCSLKYNIQRSDIRQVCKGERISAKELTFRFLDSNNNIIEVETPRNKRETPIICITNGKRYKSTNEACKELGVRSQHVSAILRGRQKTTLGYSFKYDNTVPSL
jgi:group I intron endonuclease